jgi:hypothetical protein
MKQTGIITAGLVTILSGALALIWSGDNAASDAPSLAQTMLNPDIEAAILGQLPELPQPTEISNPEAVVPPQCYTKTEGQFNPCYTCHQNHNDGRPNYMFDLNLQAAYSFSSLGETNHWQNLFVDRQQAIRAIRDRDIDRYVSQDNYSQLADRLHQSDWQGFIPDLKNLAAKREAFDERGFAKDGSGWVAFNYKPLPSTFWHTNGSSDDVMIRLPPRFRQDEQGQPSQLIYALNLALLEMMIKNRDEISIFPTDERQVDLDLNGDGRMNSTPVSTLKVRSHYLGGASQEPTQRYLYPADTEFLHSVRYLKVQHDEVGMANRMKELRYMKKHSMVSPANLRSRYTNERLEKLDGQLPAYVWLGERGYDNGFGWQIQGFIEGRNGHLRPQTREENLFCMGCHSTVGATIDQTFAFARKMDGELGWGYIDLTEQWDAPRRRPDQDTAEPMGEIAQYLTRVGGGDEFRENAEMRTRFFTTSGTLKKDALKGKTVAELITPSPSRARQLNKAYFTIVRTQSFVFGRDANLRPVDNVYRQVNPDEAPTLGAAFQYNSDIRLKW